MFGAVPGVYRNIVAAKIAAEAYTVEEKEEWVLMFKCCDGTTWYNPCRVADLDMAELEGYRKYEG